MDKTARALHILLAILVTFWWTPAAAQRLALVIGNSAYASTNPLPNADNDARLFAKFLSGNGYSVTELIDVNRAAMARGIAAFTARIEAGDTAVFFYAGHGMQLRGENFLIGVDARLETEFDVPAETISLDAIISEYERRAAISLLFIDACRDNPIANQLITSIEGLTRGGQTRGLAPVTSTGAGTMIAFSASPGQVAYDGGEANSPFTLSLTAHLATPSVEIGTAFKRVIRDVRLKTKGRQSPQIVSNLAEEIYLGPVLPSGDEKPAAAVQVAATPAQTVDTKVDRPASVVEPPAESGPSVGPSPAAPVEMPGPQEMVLLSPIDSLQFNKLASQPLARIPTEAERRMEQLDFAKVERIATARGWQRFLKKYPTGQLAAAAIAKLHDVENKEPRTPEAMEGRFELTEQNTRHVQLALAALGYAPGSADGSIGPRTRRELARYQKTIGLDATGYLNAGTLRSLEVKDVRFRDDAVSSSRARLMRAEDLEAIEVDPRIIQFARCLEGRDFVYGEFEGHVYAAVQWYGISWSGTKLLAGRCKASLVTISSAAENAFVYSLFASDHRFFSTGFDPRYGYTYKGGPWIGLAQKPGAPEPGGGWYWLDGDQSRYRNWLPTKPSEAKKEQDFATFFGEVRGNTADRLKLNASRWKDVESSATAHGYILELN